eukprot:COSAG05_NODE_27_length_29281_cov_199.946919_7_plen_93_part_00
MHHAWQTADCFRHSYSLLHSQEASRYVKCHINMYGLYDKETSSRHPILESSCVMVRLPSISSQVNDGVNACGNFTATHPTMGTHRKTDTERV